MLLWKPTPMMLQMREPITTITTMTQPMQNNTIRSEFVVNTMKLYNDNMTIQYLVTMPSMTPQLDHWATDMTSIPMMSLSRSRVVDLLLQTSFHSLHPSVSP